MTIGEFKKLLESSPDDIDISSLFPPKEEVKIILPEMAAEIPVKGAVANIKHSTNPGDMVASLLSCKRYWELTGRKVKFLQKINFPAQYYRDATHPTVDEKGANVTLNKPMFDMMKPLMESQEYIDSMEAYEGQRVDLDFDVIRGKTFVNMPQGSIQGWLFFAYPDLATDISKSWVKLSEQKHQIEEITKTKVLINFTERYRNSRIILDYFFLKGYSPDLMFIGTETEHFKFCSQWNLTIPRLEVKDFLELAYAIRSCRFLLSNQSLAWNLGTALGIKRVLEVCDFAHNCLPFYGTGDDGKLNNVGYFHQAGLEFWFRTMYDDTMNK